MKKIAFILLGILTLAFIFGNSYIYSQEEDQEAFSQKNLGGIIDFSPATQGTIIEPIVTADYKPITIDETGKAVGAILNINKQIQDPICLEKLDTEGCALELVIELQTHKTRKPLGKIFADAWSTGNSHAIMVNMGDSVIIPLEEGKVDIKRLSDDAVDGYYDRDSLVTINIIALIY